jgi:hypothetical protein
MHVAQDDERSVLRREDPVEDVEDLHGRGFQLHVRLAPRCEALHRRPQAPGAPQRREAAVTGDAEQPRLGVPDLSQHRPVAKRRNEGLLEQVTGKLALPDELHEERTEPAFVQDEEPLNGRGVSVEQGARLLHRGDHAT